MVAGVVGSPLIVVLTAIALGAAGSPASDFGLAGLVLIVVVPTVLYVMALGKVMGVPSREWGWVALFAVLTTGVLGFLFIWWVVSHID